VNLLDRAIGWVAPEAGLRRSQARATLTLVRAYEGAAIGRRTSGWKTSSASGNMEILSAGMRLRDRARDLVRNNPYAKRAIACIVGNSVGTGITLGIDGQIAKIWDLWCAESDYAGELDIYGQQALATRAMVESGGSLIVRRRLGGNDAASMASGVPLQIQVLEIDHLDALKYGVAANGNFIVSGIEVDKYGRRIAYWLYPQHPGDVPFFVRSLTSERFLAEDVIHLFEKVENRPGVLQGVPKLGASIIKLRDLDEYNEALLVKKKIEACFAAFVTTNDESKTISDKVTDNPDDAAAGGSTRQEELAPGLINYLRPDESVTFADPSAIAADSFTVDQLHAIAVGAGVTYEQLTGDLSRVNYSSTRFGRQEFKILIEQMRWLTIIPMGLERVYRWFEEAANMAGKVRTRGYDHKWTPPRWEYVNPKEDVETDLLELRAKLASHSEKVRERGQDPVKVYAEIAADQETFAELDIEPDYGSKIQTTPQPATAAPAATTDSNAADAADANATGGDAGAGDAAAGDA
jgi:lambda family phage portal protein